MVSDYLIYGVDHDDPRNEEMILKMTDGPVVGVFHEQDPDPSLWEVLYWCLKTPTQAVVTAGSELLKLALAVPLWFLGLLNNESGSGSNCEEAARALAERHNCGPVTQVDMPYGIRAKKKPWRYTVVEFGTPVLAVLVVLALLLPINGNSSSTVVLIMVALSLFFIVHQSILFIFVGYYMRGMSLYRRDKWMFEQIVENAEVGRQVIIVGQDHVAGIGGRLQSRGYDVDAVWLNSYLKAG
jgi:hypothetical protein